MSFSQIFSMVVARKLIAIWVFVATILVTAIISFFLPNGYTATTSLVVNTKGADPVTGFVMPNTLMPGYIATQVDIIESDNVALKVVDKLQVTKEPTAIERFMRSTDGEGDIRLWYAEQFKDHLDVKPSRESNVIQLSFTGIDPDFAAKMANEFASAYIETNLELKTGPAKQAAEFFDKQLKGLRENVEKAQARLTAFQKDHEITSGMSLESGRLDIEMARLAELSSQLVLAQAQSYDTQSKQKQLRKSNANSSPEILSSSLIQGLKSQLAIAESKLSDLSQMLGANHPRYQAVEKEIKTLRGAISREISRASGGVSQTANVSKLREDEIEASLKAQKARVLMLKTEQDEMAALIREAESAQRIYDGALLKFGQTNIESKSGQTDISILNKATPPLTHSTPTRKLNIALSIIFGFLLAVAIALIYEMLNRKVRGAEDLTKSLGLPLLVDLTNAKV